jgi:hypothetical protein
VACRGKKGIVNSIRHNGRERNPGLKEKGDCESTIELVGGSGFGSSGLILKAW